MLLTATLGGRAPGPAPGLAPGATGEPTGPGVPAGASAGPGGASPAGSASPTPGTSASPGSSPSASPGQTPSGDPRPAPTVASWLPFLLDARLAELRSLSGIPGLSVTILFRDGTRWTGVGGQADVAGAVPVRPGTSFAIASISKTFTAALVLALVEEGRLTLEEAAVPRLAGVSGVTIDRRITIAQLLNHTSGLRDFLLEPKIEPAFAADPDAAWAPAQSFAYVGRPLAAPGERFFYSNTNYLLLGLIAERVTGQPMAVNLRARFFEPLGLRTASYQSAEVPRLPLAHGYRFTTGLATEAPILIPSATGVVPFNAVVTAAGGAGSVAAASPDIAAWARALYVGRVLQASTVTRMLDDAARTKALDPAQPYGHGVQVVAVDGHPSFGHSGRYLGARSVVRHFPLEGLTIAVLTNQSRTDPTDILIDLLRLVLAGQPPAS